MCCAGRDIGRADAQIDHRLSGPEPVALHLREHREDAGLKKFHPFGKLHLVHFPLSINPD
jgi:hypothetical protein